MVKVISEPGHGGNTWPPSKGTHASGGIPGMAEHDFNAAVADETKRLLSGKLSVFSAQPSKGSDVPLNARIRAYNAEYGKDKSLIGMSHHGNANGNKNTRGFGVFYWHTSADGKRLAQMILAEYKREFPDMPIWGSGIFASKIGDWTNFAILRDTAAPFVLIEWEFFTNDAARKIMLTGDYRKRCGKVAARTAAAWHGVKLEEETPVQVSKPVVKPAAPKPTAPVVKPAVTKPLIDVNAPDKWAAEEWTDAKELKYFDGTRPRDPISRQEAAIVTMRQQENFENQLDALRKSLQK